MCRLQREFGINYQLVSDGKIRGPTVLVSDIREIINYHDVYKKYFCTWKEKTDV